MASKVKVQKKEETDFAESLVDLVIDHYSETFPSETATAEEKRAAFADFARSVDALKNHVADTAIALVRQKLIV
jgi:hypothetical protein